MPSAYKVKIAGVGGCCPCNQTHGCDCGAVSCSLSCQIKEGTGQLCGFPEYTDPSLPPVFYRKKTKAGTMRQCNWNQAGCPDNTCSTPAGAPTYAGSGGFSVLLGFTGPDHDVPYYDNIAFSMTAVPTGSFVGNNAEYLISGTATATNSLTGAVVGLSTRLHITYTGSDNVYNGTYNLPSCAAGLASVMTAIIQINYFGWQERTETTGTFVPPPPTMPQNAETDVWNLVSQYDPATCLLSQTDTGTRKVQLYSPCPPDGTGTLTNPTAEPPGALVTETLDQVSRTLDGTETCTQTATLPVPVYSKAIGEITEILSDADTEDDAMARAVDGDGIPLEYILHDPPDCANHPAFITERGAGETSFGFRQTQVKATAAGLTVGLSYTCTIRFYRRAVGSGGTWIFFSQTIITFTATDPANSTAWIDVPNEAGWETRPQTCSFVPS